MAETWRNIDHVVVLMQENLSFDRVLGWTKELGADGVPDGLTLPVDDPLFPPGTRLVPEEGAALVPPGAAHMPWDMNDQLFSGPNGVGFVKTLLRQARKTKGLDDQGQRALVREGLRHHRRDELPVYRDLARNFAVADRWFAPIASATWPNRYFVHMGTSPSGAAPIPELGGNATIYDRLAAAGLSWRIYVDGPATLVTSRSVVGAARRARRRALVAGASEEDAPAIRPFSQFACDVSRSDTRHLGVDGYEPLPTYTFIEPRHWPTAQFPANNDHHHTHLHDGQRLVASIYHTLRSDPVRWARTLFVVTYDEHGGYWDHVTPDAVPDPATGTAGQGSGATGLDFHGGRVPALLISPWITQGAYHNGCDHTSILAFLERRFALAPLTRRDAWIDDLTGAFGPDLRGTPERLEVPTAPARLARTGDLDRDFTGMALDLYRHLASLEGADGDAELRMLGWEAIAARGEARMRAFLARLRDDRAAV